MLVGAVLTFVAALWPRKSSRVSLRQTQARDARADMREVRESGSAGASRAAPSSAESSDLTTQPLNYSTTSAARKLLHWPPFYFSLLFLLYLTIQAFNPSITVVHGDGGWWVEKIQAPLAAWLPTSVRSDFEPMNAFRVLEWFTASFLLMWGIWAGLTRRKTVIFILWALVLSGSGMALVAIIQDLTQADKVLMTFKSANEHFWGSFFYRNQGAAYLNLMLIGIGFLYFYHAKKSAENYKSGGPHLLLFLLFALVAASVALALSRGGIIFGAILSIGFVGGVIFQALLVSQRKGSSIAIILIMASLMSAGGYLMIKQINFSAIVDRFGDVEATLDNADQDVRTISTKATWDMVKDSVLLGWGAGSFRYIFPIYQRQYPNIFYKSFRERKGGWFGRRVYHYAHNDILQFWAEYGAIGCGLLVLTFASLIYPLVKSTFYFPLSIFHLMVGAATIIAHAFFDFILNSPAFWVALIGFLATASKLMALEGRILFRISR